MGTPRAAAMPGWGYPPPPKPALPVVPTEYPGFWRTPAWSAWRPIVLVVLAVIAYFAGGLVFMAVAIMIDMMTGRQTWEEAVGEIANDGGVTPMVFLGNNLSLALLIVIAIALTVLLIKQRPGWLASVTGRMRWGWMGTCFTIVLPIWMVYLSLDTWLQLQAGPLGLAPNRDTVVLAIGILVTTPLQCAGEEYAFRGLINRAAASFFTHQRVGLVVGAVLSSLVFMLAHAAADPWLNVFYFSFGLIACYVTWRTGGLEASIAMHIVNNLLSEAFMPFMDITEVFDRSAGTGSPWVLIGIVTPLIAAAAITWQARKLGITRSSAPAASRVSAPAPAFPPGPGQFVQAPGWPAGAPQPWAPAAGVHQPGAGQVVPPTGTAAAPLADPASPSSSGFAGGQAGGDRPPTPAGEHPAPLSNPRPWDDPLPGEGPSPSS